MSPVCESAVIFSCPDESLYSPYGDSVMQVPDGNDLYDVFASPGTASTII
jgi:hypothetical protein